MESKVSSGSESLALKGSDKLWAVYNKNLFSPFLLGTVTSSILSSGNGSWPVYHPNCAWMLSRKVPLGMGQIHAG